MLWKLQSAQQKTLPIVHWIHDQKQCCGSYSQLSRKPYRLSTGFTTRSNAVEVTVSSAENPTDCPLDSRPEAMLWKLQSAQQKPLPIVHWIHDQKQCCGSYSQLSRKPYR